MVIFLQFLVKFHGKKKWEPQHDHVFPNPCYNKGTAISQSKDVLCCSLKGHHRHAFNEYQQHIYNMSLDVSSVLLTKYDSKPVSSAIETSQITETLHIANFAIILSRE